MKKRVKTGLILLVCWLGLWIFTVVSANAEPLKVIKDFAFIPFFIGSLCLIAAVGTFFSCLIFRKSGRKSNDSNYYDTENYEQPYETQYTQDNSVSYETQNNIQNGNVSDSGLTCPRCGAPIPTDGGAFCTNCGTRLFNVGGAPGAFDVGTVASPKRMKNNAYANIKAVGFVTHWKATKAEVVIIWIAFFLSLGSIIAGICISKNTGDALPFGIGIAVGILIVIIAFAISAINPAHRKEQKENMFKYGGTIDYSANPLNGQVQDNSQMHIEKAYSDDERDHNI